MDEAVDHPAHYGGKDNPYEVIKVLEAWLTPEEFAGFLKGNVIKYQARARSGRHWVCRCACGATAVVATSELRKGDTKSCGCLRIATARSRGQSNHKHGAACDGAETPEYRAWVEMRRRCRDSNHIGYERYGGRGITVCERWTDFEAFLADMGQKPTPTHSIDRRDNDGNYEPGNVRWATPEQQQNNRSNNKH